MDRRALRRGTRITIWLLAGLAVLAFVGGCDLLGGETMSKEDRVDAFMGDLNAHDWSGMATHIHPGNDQRNILNSSEAWRPPFTAESSFDYTSPQVNGDTVTIKITESSQSEYVGATWTFTMKEDSDALWFIDKLTSDQGTPTTIIPN